MAPNTVQPLYQLYTYLQCEENKRFIIIIIIIIINGSDFQGFRALKGQRHEIFDLYIFS